MAPIHYAAKASSVGAVRLLLNADGIDANLTCGTGNTSLHLASEIGNLEIVKVLSVVKDAPLNLGNDRTLTPLHLAADNNHVEVVRFLVQVPGIDVNAKGEFEVYFCLFIKHLFIMHADVDILMLLEH